MVFEEVAHRDEDDDGVCSGGRSGGVDAGGDVDVEARLVGNLLEFEDGVEGFAVVVCEKDVVGFELGDCAVEGPVEGDGRAGGGTAGEGEGVVGGGEEVVVGVDEVGVDDDDGGGDGFAGRKGYAGGVVGRGDVDMGDGGGEAVGNA